MSADKLQLFLVYGIACLWVGVLLPSLDWWRSSRGEPALVGNRALISGERFGLAAGLVVLALMLVFLTGWSWRHLSYAAIASLLIPAIVRRFDAASVCWVAIAVLLASLLPWWLRQDAGRLSLSGSKWTAVLLITAGIVWMMRRRPEGRVTQSVVFKWALGLIALIVAAAWTFSTGLSSTHANTTPWHHWGAYVGPAETVMAGAVPFHDVPLQYGLGPTLLLMLGGPSGAWSVMYWVAGLMTVAMILVLCRVAWRLLDEDAAPAEVSVVVLAMLTCGLIWTAYPAEIMATLATPSTTGLRFLPGAFFLCLLVEHEQRLARAIERRRAAPTWGHVVWLFCLAWSPEAALHGTALWVPYLIWSSAPRGDWLSLLRSSISGLLLLAAVLSCGVLVFVALFWLNWREWPLLSEYVAYIKYPPGPLPVNRQGAVWFAVGAFVAFGFACSGSALSDLPAQGYKFRKAWLVVLLGVAVFPYYMGRSHDNNILNLLSFIALVLLAARSVAQAAWLRRFCEVAFAFSLSWVAVFGPHNLKHAWAAGQLLSFEPVALLSSFDRDDKRSFFYLNSQARTAGIEPEDLAQALQTIRSEHHEAIETLDLFMLVDQGEPVQPWNALHGPENFVYFPPEMRQRYLTRVAARLKRPGWVIHGPGPDVEAMLADYDAVYQRTEERKFGTYRAVRYVPQQ